MTISIEEKPNTRRASKDLVQAEYTVLGTIEPATARELLKVAVPQVVDGLVVQTPEVRESSTFHENGAYDGTVRWEPRKEPEIGERTFRFEGSSGSWKVYQAIDHIAAYGTAPPDSDNAKGAINWNPTTGKVEGAEVPSGPHSTFTLTLSIPAGEITAEKIDFLERSQRKTNESKWSITTDDGVELTFEPEECYFAKIAGGKRIEEDWNLTAVFYGQRTRQNFQVGDITVNEKRGWHHMGIVYGDTVDNNVRIQVPKWVTINRVIEMADFNEF